MTDKSISGVNAMKTNKGFTLLEVAVVLAVIAILAAMLTPIVTSYIDQARVTRAQNDVKKIAEAVLLFKRDTGFFPGYNITSEATSGAILSGNSNGLSGCLISGSGAIALSNTGSAYFTGNWTCANPGLLETYLNVNSLGVATSGLGAVGGKTAYRGPYLDGLAGTDPWGHPYAVNSANFASSATNYAYAISAGPDSTFDTPINVAKSSTFAASDDDIVALIK
jgi:prepilin-type N-terminal cleavage/methylation domain-containing protein